MDVACPGWGICVTDLRPALALPIITKRPAKNQVERPLHEGRKSESVENKLKLLSDQTKIEYVPPHDVGRHRAVHTLKIDRDATGCA
jgi:hypothetical protein